MHLIIKPTGRCNFNCKFCSAHGLDINHPSDGKVPEKIKELINKLKPNSLIITGGEPLMVDPEYYYELYDIAKCPISATTNLKDFYYHPEKWAGLFKEKWFSIATSFNYGNTRMWSPTEVYTEELFIKVMDKYKEYVGGRLPIFLAVIDESNEDTIIDHVLLAKRLGTQVKLNNAISAGLQSKTYQRYQIFKHYLKIIEMGLSDYEYYCSARHLDECPRNINHFCSTSLRCCYLDNDGKLHVATCDEQLSLGHEIPEELIVPESRVPVSEVLDPSEYITPECPCCNLFSLCNGCRTNRDGAKQDPNYCKEMKKLEDKIIETGWLL